MAEYYKGERIEELLGEIATLEEKLNQVSTQNLNEVDTQRFAGSYAMLVVVKAKLTALQGD